MAYTIRFEGCGTTTVCARSHDHALSLAKELRLRGRRGVQIVRPDGSLIAPSPQTTANSAS